MNNLKCFLVVTWLVACSAALAAQSDTSGIFVKYGIWQHSYVKNGVKKDVGHNFSNLALEFENRPKSAPLFNKGRKKERQATALSLFGASLTVIGLGISQNQVNRATVDKNRLELGLMAIMAGALLEVAIAVPLSHKGRNQINEAVFLYNSGQ
jgi:hypothetical protein